MATVNFDTSSAHGDLTGLLNDDHTQYLLADGTRSFSGDVTIDDTYKLSTDEIRALDSGGLKLYEDSGSGIFVKDGGNVGIGTTIPLSKLHVKSSGFNTTVSRVTNSLDKTIFGIVEDSDGDGKIELRDLSEVHKVIINSNGDTYFNGGNVGIGDATPSYKLDLNGTFRVVGTSTFDSTLDVTGDFKVNTNKLIVLAATGNTTIGGTLTATSGLATFTDTSIRGIKQRTEFSASKTGQTGSPTGLWETLFSVLTYSEIGVLYISAKFIDDSSGLSHYGFATVSFSALNASLNYTIISTDDFSGLGTIVLQLSGANIQIDMGELASLGESADIVYSDVTAIFSDNSIGDYTP